MSGTRSSRRGWRRLTDPRVGLGLAVTVAALWYAFRDVDLAAIGRDMARANWAWLVLPSVPAYVWALWIRGARWRHLAHGVASFGRGAGFRATAVGFMINNLFPLRLGELARAWILARECRASGPALLGTVLVERVFDALGILGLASLVLGVLGAEAAGLEPSQVLPILAAVAAVPIAGIAALRVAPDFWVGLAGRILSALLPDRIGTRLTGFLRQFAEGLGALSDPKALFWVVFHTVVHWGVVSWIPFWAALVALDIDVGTGPEGSGVGREVLASLALLAWVGAGVAIPSAPGFIGPYHAACRLALIPLGVPKEQALALGTLAHAVFWVTHTGVGLVALRLGGRGLDETLASAEAADEGPAAAAGAPAGPDSDPAHSAR